MTIPLSPHPSVLPLAAWCRYARRPAAGGCGLTFPPKSIHKL
jgi:hypothetical protein